MGFQIPKLIILVKFDGSRNQWLEIVSKATQIRVETHVDRAAPPVAPLIGAPRLINLCLIQWGDPFVISLVGHAWL